jgi:NAD(P)-dependent dehydrogenase (short-subunit alcohol dehydrogenase family)
MEKRTVLITGATKGIGFEIARQLGKKGFRIIISGRNEAKLTEALHKLVSESITADILLMDVSNDSSIKRAVETFSDKNLKLDVLVNNAAISLKEDRSFILQHAEILMRTIYTNSYGPLKVIQSFLPFLKKHARIINISSGLGSMTDPVGGYSPAYCVSKTLLNAITRQLAFELSERGISVNAVCPGWVQTDMGGKSAPRPVEKGAETPVWLAFEAPSELTGKFFRDKHIIDW